MFAYLIYRSEMQKIHFKIYFSLTRIDESTEAISALGFGL